MEVESLFLALCPWLVEDAKIEVNKVTISKLIQ